MVSRAVPELRVLIKETGDTRVRCDVAVLPTLPGGALDLRGVTITFRHGQWVRTYPAASDVDPLPKGRFDRSFVPYGSGDVVDNPEEYLDAFREDWMARRDCPDAHFYEVMDSRWVLEENAARFGCRHFVLVSHDLWMEVLCTGMDWTWDEVGATALNLPPPSDV